MALSNVNILRQNGGITTQPVDTDGIAGLVFYTANSLTTGKFSLFQASDASTIFDADSIEMFHINEYFAKSNYQLFINVVNVLPSTFSEVTELQRYAEGAIKICGIFNNKSNFTSSQLNSIQTACNLCETEYQPLQAVYSASLGGNTIEGTAGLLDLTTLSNYRVSLTVGQNLDTNLEPYKSNPTLHIGDIGSVIGTVSSAKVSECIGFVQKFDLTNITVPGFIDGSLLNSKPKSFLDSLDAKNYLFIRKFVGLAGNYYNFDFTATNPSTDDFYRISTNLTYDKAFRALRQSYLAFVNSSIKLSKSGEIAGASVEFLKSIGDTTLNYMKASDDISDFSVKVSNKLVNNTLEVVASIVPIGVAKQINIKLGFTLSL